MGKVTTDLQITNHADEVRAGDGTIPASAVRTLALQEILVDTGATMLCLPQSFIDELGLRLVGEVSVSTAAGVMTARVFEDARVTLYGRSGTFDCVALPDGTEPLLGVIPLERLGLEPDLQNQRLRVLPDHGRRTYILAPSPLTH